MFNPDAFRAQFPYFKQKDATIYLDNAATTLKSQALIDATVAFYQSAGSVHRSQYDEENTFQYEQARELVREFIQAESVDSVIWTSGTTQAINTVANGLIPHIQKGDEIIISQADHHANFVTWHAVAQKCGAIVRVLPILDNWLIDQQALQQALNARTKVVALNFVSNVTGTVQPVAEFIRLIRQHSQAFVLVDAAQAVSHYKLNLAELDADFIAFSAHKIYGPNGLGVLSGKRASLGLLQPLIYGGKMVESVSATQISYSELPYRLEAGTPNIAGVIGFNAVLNWLSQWDFCAAEAHAVQLAEQAKKALNAIPNCQLFVAPQPSSVVSFVCQGVHTSDLATLLAEQHIALRSGVHCAQPYLARLGQASTLRLSFAPYNIQTDLNEFLFALEKSLSLLSE
ncbi:MAG: cysteine desulfurase [Pasteurellaceae bacterium]|nr:cysteine desulfurase [Pasteurellaceae bacterium]